MTFSHRVVCVFRFLHIFWGGRRYYGPTGRRSTALAFGSETTGKFVVFGGWISLHTYLALLRLDSGLEPGCSLIPPLRTAVPQAPSS